MGDDAASRFRIGKADLISRDHGELVYSNTKTTLFVDAKTWPPRMLAFGGRTQFAARQTGYELDGSWRTYTSSDVGLQTWTVKLFSSIATTQPTRDDADEIPFRDLTPFVAELDDETRGREGESWHRIESLEMCGPIVVAVPRYCGLGERRHLWVKRGGGWTEDDSLPPFERSLADAVRPPPIRCATLASGGSVLVWQGRFYLPMATHFVDYCAATLAFSDDHGPLVPWKADALFAVDGTRLVEVMLHAVREHLPDLEVRRVSPGPAGTLIVENASDVLLYDPEKQELADLRPAIGDLAISNAANDGALIVFDPGNYELRRIGPEVLAALPRVSAERPPPPTAPAVRILDHLGAAARPITTGVGDLVISCGADAVRFWNVDVPFAKVPLAALAVAVREDRVAVLDTRGVLHELDLQGALLGSRPVTDRPRSLAPSTDRWIVIAEDAVWLAGASLERIDVAGAIAAAADPDGTIVIISEDRRLARWEGGQLIDIPESVEQLVSIAPLGDRRFVCAGERNLFLLDLAQLELEALYEQNETPFVCASPDGNTIAWATFQHVSIARLTGTKVEVFETSRYPDTFMEPEDEPLRVRGLAFLDDDRLVVAINNGFGGDVLSFADKTSKKLDPHPGDTRNRYLHTYAGVVLVCEDP